jgi:hypothetical protein
MADGTLLRRGIAAGTIGGLALAVGGLGVATAANGGSLTLGHSNSATATTTLKDRKGTPLSLVGKATVPPLKVNSSKQVAHLNASLLGGKSARALSTRGSGSETSPAVNNGVRLSTMIHFATRIASTARLSAGTYYVSASAWTRDGGSSGVICFIGSDSDYDHAYGLSETPGAVYQSEALTAVVTLKTPTKIGEYCTGAGDAGSLAYDAGIFAIKVAHSVPGVAATPIPLS